MLPWKLHRRMYASDQLCAMAAMPRKFLGTKAYSSRFSTTNQPLELGALPLTIKYWPDGNGCFWRATSSPLFLITTSTMEFGPPLTSISHLPLTETFVGAEGETTKLVRLTSK